MEKKVLIIVLKEDKINLYLLLLEERGRQRNKMRSIKKAADQGEGCRQKGNKYGEPETEAPYSASGEKGPSS